MGTIEDEYWKAGGEAPDLDGPKFKFKNVSCSQCGRDFGPGNHGFSHCFDHMGKTKEQLALVKR